MDAQGRGARAIYPRGRAGEGLALRNVVAGLCVGFGAAAKLAEERQTRDYDHVEKLWKAALHALGPGWTINGSTSHRYKGNLNIRGKGMLMVLA